MHRIPVITATLIFLSSSLSAQAETPIEAATRMGNQCTAWGNNGCAVLCQGSVRNMTMLPAAMHAGLLDACRRVYDAAAQTQAGSTAAQVPTPASSQSPSPGPQGSGAATPATQTPAGNATSAEMLRLAKQCQELGAVGRTCARRCEQYAALPPSDPVMPSRQAQDLEACRKLHAQAAVVPVLNPAQSVVELRRIAQECAKPSNTNQQAGHTCSTYCAQAADSIEGDIRQGKTPRTEPYVLLDGCRRYQKEAAAAP